jgi:hypothetical protein
MEQATRAFSAGHERAAIARGRAAHTIELELLAFEMALDAAHPSAANFRDGVTKAAEAVDGAFLFDLPGSGLMPGCERIAAVHLPIAPHGQLAFALLSRDDQVSAILPNAQLEDLSRFAQAFMELHENLVGLLPNAN